MGLNHREREGVKVRSPVTMTDGQPTWTGVPHIRASWPSKHYCLAASSEFHGHTPGAGSVRDVTSHEGRFFYLIDRRV